MFIIILNMLYGVAKFSAFRASLQYSKIMLWTVVVDVRIRRAIALFQRTFGHTRHDRHASVCHRVNRFPQKNGAARDDNATRIVDGSSLSDRVIVNCYIMYNNMLPRY